MLFKPMIGSQLSGSMGGLVAARNKGGTYFRQRAMPVNPASTPQQVAVRTILANLANSWTTNLTDAQRAGWTTYANNLPLLNRIGDSRIIPPLSMYTRCNAARIQAGYARIDDAPVDYTNTPLDPVFADGFVAGPPSTADINYTAADPWNAAGGALIVFCSRPQNTTIQFFKGPYQLAGSVDGTGPGVPPETMTLPFDVVAGQRIFFRVVASGADGRLSATQTFLLDA